MNDNLVLSWLEEWKSMRRDAERYRGLRKIATRPLIRTAFILQGFENGEEFDVKVDKAIEGLLK